MSKTERNNKAKAEENKRKKRVVIVGDFHLSEDNLIRCHQARIVWASEDTQNKKDYWQCFPFAEGRGNIQLRSQGDNKTSDHSRRNLSQLLCREFFL